MIYLCETRVSIFFYDGIILEYKLTYNQFRDYVKNKPLRAVERKTVLETLHGVPSRFEANVTHELLESIILLKIIDNF